MWLEQEVEMLSLFFVNSKRPIPRYLSDSLLLVKASGSPSVNSISFQKGLGLKRKMQKGFVH
jgi:hypothetical protein